MNGADTELLTDQQIAEIEARANAATKEPWIAELRSWPIGDTGDYEPCADVLAVHGDVAKPRVIGMFHELSADVNAQAANCAFTAHARADIPALIATVKQLRSELADEKRLRAELKQIAQTGIAEVSSVGTTLGEIALRDFRSRAVDLCNQKAAEYASVAGELRDRRSEAKAEAAREIREGLEKLT